MDVGELIQDDSVRLHRLEDVHNGGVLPLRLLAEYDVGAPVLEQVKALSGVQAVAI